VTVVAQTSIIALPSPSLSLLAVAIAPTAHDTRLRRNTPRGSPHVAVARQTSVKGTSPISRSNRSRPPTHTLAGLGARHSNTPAAPCSSPSNQRMRQPPQLLTIETVSRHPDHLTHDVRAQESHWYVTDSKLKPPRNIAPPCRSSPLRLPADGCAVLPLGSFAPLPHPTRVSGPNHRVSIRRVPWSAGGYPGADPCIWRGPAAYWAPWSPWVLGERKEAVPDGWDVPAPPPLTSRAAPLAPANSTPRCSPSHCKLAALRLTAWTGPSPTRPPGGMGNFFANMPTLAFRPRL
jgi:hypothetical protein